MGDIIKKIGLAAALLFPLGAASADEGAYRINAYADRTIPLRLCGPATVVFAAGDGDTDLDFWLYNSAGRMIHEDIDPTDTMIKTVHNGRGCGNYRLVVRNLGGVYNRMELSAQDA